MSAQCALPIITALPDNQKLRLTHIKLAGFKSFVDPTSIPVSHDLVGIVGPNGCGKSNIIDAVRWVLGESKAAALRGDSMQDVIFAGSDNRKAVGRASVEIVFENRLGKVTGQWSSYGEIAIKRVLQRDGASSYFINNLQVRRRDIADLFLGTGAGSRGYAIIEQGMISQIIEAKPQELRNFLEEAAGISQYRERRQETSARLAETRKNLIRLEDIYQELGAQLRRLEVQAAVASQYQALQERLQNSQALLWYQRKIEATLHYEQFKHEIAELGAELQSVVSTQRSAEKEFEEIRLSEYRTNDRLLQVQGRLYGADAEIGRLEQLINHIHATKERLIQQAQQVEDQLQKNDRLKTVSLEQLAQWRLEKTNAEQSHQQNLLQYEAQNQNLPAMEADHRRYRDELSEYRHSLVMAEQNNQLENNHISHATKNIQQLEARQIRLTKERDGLAVIDDDRLTKLRQEIDQIEAILKQNNQEQQLIERQLSVSAQLKQKIVQDIQESEHGLSKAAARQTALHNLQQKLENNQQLSAWLSGKHLNVLPRLWQNIQVSPQWETALEAILRERLNSIQLAQLDQLLDSVNGLPLGKWAVFEDALIVQPRPVDQRPLVSHSSANGKLLAFLTFGETKVQYILEDWLCHVYVAESIREAFAKRPDLRLGEMAVTPEGHIVTRHSCTFYAPDSQLHGVLSRQQEIASLQTEIERFEATIAKQQNGLAETERQYSQLSAEIQRMRENGGQLQQRSHQLQLEAAKLSQTNEQTANRKQQINSELNEIKQALDNELALRQAATANLADNQLQIDILKRKVEQVRLAWEGADASLATHRQAIQQSTRKIQEIVFHLKTCENKINEVRLAIDHIDEEIRQLSGNRINLLKEIDACDDTSTKALLEAAQTHRTTIESEVEQVRQEMAGTAHRLREIEVTRMASEQKSHGLRDAISQAQLKEQATLLNIDQLNEMISGLHIDMASLMPLAGKKTISALQSEIQRLNKEISALGPVNLAAIGEHENAQARESDLMTQLNDLNDAIATLESAIRQIDRETQMRLQETFMQVNAHLSEIFPVIFAGGQAKLIFLDDEAIDAGFILMAQPPGKKNSSIHLLSGGEKALTALALVFSLFKLNPAPFCLLDEVDAPLDDSNTERFCELVKQMAKQTQFLFISHNKITMEMAYRLIGVTMQEQGVSRVVAVDLADAIQLGKRETQLIIE